MSIVLCLTAVSATVWAAPDTLIQTLTNLLSNAIKFSSAGSTVWLTAELERYTEQFAAPCILFTVKDRGRGILPDKLAILNIFS